VVTAEVTNQDAAELRIRVLKSWCEVRWPNSRTYWPVTTTRAIPPR
jgi:hypothetical protein